MFEIFSENYNLRERKEKKAMTEEPNVVNEELKDKEAIEYIGTDLSYTHTIVWRNVIFYIVLHLLAAIGMYKCLTGTVLVSTIIWAWFYTYVSIEGVCIGAHRGLSHRSFKATPLLKCILLFMHNSAGQNFMFTWARDHRQHHRYSDTDGDPHNAKRGLFYSHMGWLMSYRHPICRKLRKTTDITDLLQDKYIMFEYKYFFHLFFLTGFAIPVGVAVWCFNESLMNAFLVCFCLRYTLSLHAIWLFNSAAHKFGTRPYDKNIQPVETRIVSLLNAGEGWHNYHHAFPWDYKAAELPTPYNFSATMIDFFAKLNLAYDLKSMPSDSVQKRIKSVGDGTHSEFGFNDDIVTAFGPVHPMNPTYTVTYPDPEIKRPLPNGFTQ